MIDTEKLSRLLEEVNIAVDGYAAHEAFCQVLF